MLNLDKLVFEVDTAQLDSAIKKIEQLGSGLTGLAATTKQVTTASVEESKARTAAAKAVEVEARAKAANTKAAETETKVVRENTRSIKDQQSVLEKQKSIRDFQAEGFSKGQATVLAYAKATGAATSEIKELMTVLQDQRKLMGGDPFDKSISGLVSLKNQTRELITANKLYNEGIEVTRQQARDFARDKERLVLAAKTEGASLSEIKARLRDLKSEYVSATQVYNTHTASEKEVERARRDKLNATRAVSAAEERMTSIMKSMNIEAGNQVSVSENAAIKIAAYERNLRLAGVGAVEAANKLKIYKDQMIQVQSIEEKRKMDYLSRALAPQISDVVVSLASGMNPMTVLLQQGLQVRDLIGQSGVETKKLQETFALAAADMVSSIRGTSVAIGSLFIGTLKSAGASIFEFITLPARIAADAFGLLGTSAKNAIGFHKNLMDLDTSVGPQIDGATLAVRNYKDSIQELSKAWVAASKVALTLAGIVGTTLLIALFQVMNATTQMNKELNLNGAILGLTTKEASNLADSYVQMGVTAADARNAVGEFAKSGIRDQSTLATAIQGAIALQQNLGVSVEDTAKKFSDLSKNPVKALLDVAKGTGLVYEETIKHVSSLVKQGKQQEAVTLAQYAYIAALEGLNLSAQENLTPIENLWKDIKKAVSEAWGQIQNTADSLGIFEFMSKALAGVAYGAKVVGNAFAFVGLAMRSIKEGDIKEVIAFTSGEMAAAKQEYLKTVAEIDSRSERRSKDQKREAGERKKNAEQAISLEKQLKDAEKKNKEKIDTEKGYYSMLEKFSDIEVQIAKARAEGTESIETTTKAYAALQDMLNNETWKNASPREKELILLKYEKVAALEIELMLYEKQKKALEELTKVQEDFQKASTARDADIAKKSAELEFQFSILGKSSDEVRAMTIAYNEQAKVAEITTKYEAARLDILQQYNKAKEGLNDAFEILAAETNLRNSLSDLDKQRLAEITNARKEANLEVVKHYQKVWDEIQGGIAEALYVALTEGGKKGSLKIKDLIKAQLKKLAMEPITFVAKVVMDTGRSLLGGAIGGLAKVLGIDTGEGSFAGGLISSITGAKQGYDILSAAYKTYTAITTGAGALPGTATAANAAGALGGDAIGTFIKLNPQWGTEIGKSAGQAAGQEASKQLAQNATSMWANAINIAGAGLSAYGVGAAIGQKYGPVAGTAAGTLAGVGSYAVGSSLAAGTGLAGTAGAMASVPVYGWIAAAALALIGTLSGKKPKMYGDIVRSQVSDGKFSVTGREVMRRSAGGASSLEDLSQTFAATFGTLLEEFGEKANFQISAIFRKRTNYLGSFSVDGEQVAGGKSKRYSMQAFFNDVMSKGLYNAIQGSALPDQIEALFDASMDVGKMSEAITAVLNMNAVLKLSKTSLDKFIGSMDFASYRKEGERNVDTVGRMVAAVLQANKVIETLGWSLFDLSHKGFDAVSTFTEAFGGLEERDKALSQYYETFFSEEEKRASTIKYITAILKEAGAVLGESTIGTMGLKDFRNYLELVIKSSGPGSPLAIALLKVSEAFAGVATPIESAKLHILDLIEKLRNSVRSSANAERLYRADLALAMQGDVGAMERIPKSAEGYAEYLRKYSTSAYTRDLGLMKISSDLAAIAPVSSSKVTQMGELQGILTKFTADQSSLVASVNKGIQGIWNLANKYGMYLNAKAGDGMSNTAQFKVNEKGLFEAVYDQISYIVGANVTGFKNEFYAPGGVFDQTYGKAKELAALAKQVEDMRNKIISLGGIPQFAVGTNFVPDDMLAKVHKGERIIPAADNSRLFDALNNSSNDDPELVLEVRSLREELSLLRAEARATATNTAKMTKQWDRATGENDVLVVKVAP